MLLSNQRMQLSWARSICGGRRAAPSPLMRVSLGRPKWPRAGASVILPVGGAT